MSDPQSKTVVGHRVRKMERTRAHILANAIALFRSRGIRQTRSIEIASASEVSPATLFNYFPTKANLAEAWVRGEIRTFLDVLLRDAGDRGIRSHLRASCRNLAMASFSERALRLEAWRFVARASEPTLRYTAALEILFRREQERSRIRADLAASELAEMVAEAIEGGLISGLRESSDADQVTRRLVARVDLVLDGARKRNERVSMPSTKRDSAN